MPSEKRGIIRRELPMKDNTIRRIIKRVALMKYMTDLTVTRAVNRLKGFPLYQLKGSCNACGGCCETPVIQVFPLFFLLRSTRWMILSWHRLVNGFEYIGEDRAYYSFVFSCTHLDPETKKCDSYSSRPGMCRDYPLNMTCDTNPEFLSGCGYYALYKNAEKFRKALDKADLPPEKKEDLIARLHIKE
jgi:Fe-S-cluster containining protein